MSDLRCVELAGAPAEMGEAFGEQFRDDIRNLAECRMDYLVRFVTRFDPGRNLSRRGLLELVDSTTAAHQTYDAAIWAEFTGIVRAAHLTVPELLVANGLTDLRDFVLFDQPGPRTRSRAHTGECSAFLVPERMADGHPLVGQTWDMHSDAMDFTVIVRRKPDNGPETLGLTTVGCLCLIGMNAAGVSVGNTNLIPVDTQPGVNYLFTITRALRCTSAAEAADTIEATPRLSGHNFYVADAEDAFNIETTATRAHRTHVTDRVHVHTNHYLDKELRKIEFARENVRNSEWRWERLNGNFEGLRAPIRMDDCWKQLSDNTRGDGAVCNEDVNGEHGDFCTVATVVQNPAARRLWICSGGARLGTRQEFGF